MLREDVAKLNENISDDCHKIQSQYQQLQKTLERCSVLSRQLLSDTSKIASQNFVRNIGSKNFHPMVSGANLGSLSKIMSFVSGFFNNTRASGGNVSQSVPYLVGERGPEIFVPNSGGRIIPNNSSPNGKLVKIVMNINTPDVMGFNKSRNQIISELARAVRSTNNI